MIEGGGTDETVISDSGFVGFTKQGSGVGFSLVPASVNAKYPVLVYLARYAQGTVVAEPVVVTSAAWHGDTPFTALKVDVAPGGGQAGDVWRVATRPEATDAEVIRPRTDDRGNIHTSASPQVLIWKAALNGEYVATKKMLLPSLTPAIDGGSDIYDVRAFRHLKLSIEGGELAVLDPEHKIEVFLRGWDSSGRYSSKKMGAGVVNNVAIATPETNYGHIQCGEVTEALDNLEARFATRFSYVRGEVTVTVPFGGQPATFGSDMWLTLVGYP
jgi:hypothetical protein